MEPWQQEELRQLQQTRRSRFYPRCQCCAEPIQTQLQLELAPFGVDGVACERCVYKNLRETPALSGGNYA